MAIQISYTNANTGLIHNNSYHRIEKALYLNSVSAEGSPEESLQIDISIYNSAADRSAGKQPFDRESIFVPTPVFVAWFSQSVLDVAGVSFYNQMYSFLRSLDADEPGVVVSTRFDYKNDGADV